MRRAVISFASALLLVIASVATASAHPERACSFVDPLLENGDLRALSTLLGEIGDDPLACINDHVHPPDPV